MKLLRYGPSGQERPAVLTGPGRAVDVSDVVGDLIGDALSPDRLADLRRLDLTGRPTVDLTGQRLGPPIARVGKVVCVGLNYRAHAEESAMDEPDEPILFMKAPSSLCGPDDDILIPPGSTHTDYEVELAVVIGAPALYLPEVSAARDVIAGYTISNDVSERDAQLKRGGQWVKGKSYPTFNPLGPWLVSADEIADPQGLSLTLTVNGTTRQDSSTAKMIFGVYHLVHYVSQFMSLEPGDVINTGTPSGVALGGSEDDYLCPGDRITVSIAGLGTQRNSVVATPGR